MRESTVEPRSIISPIDLIRRSLSQRGMNYRFTAPVFVFLALSLPAAAEPVCSAGVYAADAFVIPDDAMTSLESARQHAWDGGSGLVGVCELLGAGGDFFATWSLFSGEVDAEFGGICVTLTTGDGTEWYSCRTPEEVATAFEAAPQTEGNVLQFNEWSDSAPGS